LIATHSQNSDLVDAGSRKRALPCLERCGLRAGQSPSAAEVLAQNGVVRLLGNSTLARGIEGVHVILDHIEEPVLRRQELDCADKVIWMGWRVEMVKVVD